MKLRQVDPDKAKGLRNAAILLFEWLGAVGIVVGIGAIPLVGRLNAWFIDRYWVLPLAAGGLVLCCGLVLAWRELEVVAEEQPDADVYRYLPIGKGPVPPWRLSTRMRLVISGSRYKFYQQPEVNLLLDQIVLARDSSYQHPLTQTIKTKFLQAASQIPWDFYRAELEPSVDKAIEARLTLAQWLESTLHAPPARLNLEQAQLPAGTTANPPGLEIERSARWARLHDELAALNGRLSEDSLSAADLIRWMGTRPGNAELLQNSPEEVVPKFIEFLTHTHLQPSELPEKLACTENRTCPDARRVDGLDAPNPTSGQPAQLVSDAAGKQPPAGSPISARDQTPTTLPAYVWIISWGLLILLPGFVALIVRAGELANSLRIACFFGAPAVLIWMSAAGASISSFWKSTPRNWGGMAKGIIQAAGAVLILAYLAFSYSRLLDPAPNQTGYLAWVDWLLAAGGGLALMSALLANVLAVVNKER